MHYYIYFINFILKDNNIEHFLFPGAFSYRNHRKTAQVKDVTSASKKNRPNYQH